MVVFGAGASYDSSSSFPLIRYPDNPLNDFGRPPLANQLFEERPSFAAIRAQFPKCLEVVPYFQTISRTVNVERELGRLQADAKDDPEVPKQLAAIRYYLETMLARCEERWKSRIQGVTNYRTLLNQIRNWKLKKPDDEICLVTFNYDTLLEDALSSLGLNLSGLTDYVSTVYKVVKLHGSINWAHPVFGSVSNIGPRLRTNFAAANDLIERISELAIGPSYEMVNEHPVASGARALFPAIAIPVETKTSYECPKEHIDTMEKFLPNVTKLLIIGWRGTEDRFLNSLAKNVDANTEMMIVSSSVDGANHVAAQIRESGVMARHVLCSNHGFTNFVTAREADQFLRS